MKTNKNQKSMNNKGFSLVELIVVIAIMAVLVAVLAPQFTKYIDRSRQSNDATTVAGIVTAAEVAVTDRVDYPDIVVGTYTITVAEDGTTVECSDDDAEAAMTLAITDACGALDTLTRTANTWTEDIEITVTYATTGAVTVEYSTEFDTYINAN